MVGVLAALAMVGYRKYLNSAHNAEAKAVIQMIRGAQETYRAEMLTYLNVSTGITSWYPQNALPNDNRYAWVAPTHPDWANWAKLNIAPDGPVRFGYASIAGVGGTVPQFPAPYTSPPAAVAVRSRPAFQLSSSSARVATSASAVARVA